MAADSLRQPKIIKKVSQIIPGKLYRYEADVDLLTNMATIVTTSSKAWHYLVGVSFIKNGKTKKCFVDLNSGRDNRSVKKVSLSSLLKKKKEIHEIDDSNGKICRFSCRDHKQVVNLALKAVDEDHEYDLLSSNCAMFAFYCKLKSKKTIKDVRHDFGQRDEIKIAYLDQ